MDLPEQSAADDACPDASVRCADLGARRGGWVTAGAALCLVVAFAYALRGGLFLDPMREAPSFVSAGAEEASRFEAFRRSLSLGDQLFTIHVIARNARAWLTDPVHIFDAEQCHPVEAALALGEPALTLGLLGAPAWLVSGDPIFTYDAVVWLLTLLSAAAMFWTVSQWTRRTDAALIAASLYAFHDMRLLDVQHLFTRDMVWTVLALGFFVRWLDAGRWRDVLGLGLSIALQVGGSLYPLIGAAALAAPFAVWGLATRGVRNTAWPQWVVLAGLVVGAVAFCLGPYLQSAPAADLTTRPLQVFLPWASIAPWSARGFGFVLLGLALAAFLPAASPEGSPLAAGRDGRRFALLIGIGLVIALSTGGNQVAVATAVREGTAPPFAWPNLYAALAAVVPGLGVVRVPASIVIAAHLGLCLLAGYGASALICRAPLRARTAVSAGLVVVTLVAVLDIVHPGVGHLEPRAVRPSEDALGLFAALDAAGDDGPLFEWPAQKLDPTRGGESVLLTAYHGRRTSRCYNSFRPERVREAEALGEALPEASAFAALAAMGFRTLVLHDLPGRPALRDRADEIVRSGTLSGWLVPLAERPSIRALSIAPDAAAAEARRAARRGRLEGAARSDRDPASIRAAWPVRQSASIGVGGRSTARRTASPGRKRGWPSVSPSSTIARNRPL